MASKQDFDGHLEGKDHCFKIHRLKKKLKNSQKTCLHYWIVPLLIDAKHKVYKVEKKRLKLNCT